MSANPTAERPIGVYLVALYFVLAGFLESIQKYREWRGPISLNPIAERSVWELVVHTAIYLVVAYLIWNFASLGRIAALVYGYLTLGTYLGSGVFYVLYEGEEPLAVTPLFVIIGIYHVLALVPVVSYLQPARRKKLFRVSLLEILLSQE